MASEVIWRGEFRQLTPAEVAGLFVTEYFGREREVVGLHGEWGGLGPAIYAGRFRLADGNAWYVLTRDSFGTWSVSRE